MLFSSTTMSYVLLSRTFSKVIFSQLVPCHTCLPYIETRSVTEPAGALALAGLKRYIVDHKLVGAQKKFVAVVSGANMNFDRLRFVAERAELGEGREALLSVDIPEKPGRCVSQIFFHRVLQRSLHLATLHCIP
jgi:hypothetical protein